jgi:hypothetical protein
VKKNGFVLPLIPILIIAILLVVVFWSKINSYFPKFTPMVVSDVSPSPTITPSPTAIPKPTPAKSPTASTPKPSQAAVSGPPGVGYSTITVATEKGNFSASVLSIDLNSARMITDTGNDSDCSDNCTVMSLADYVGRNGGFAGVNGTYFCPSEYPECAGKKNTFDFSVYNTRVGHWINQGMLSWGSRAIVYFDGSGAHYNQNASGFSGGLSAGIVNYPGLVDNGNIQIDDSQSGLSDKQRAVGTKVGIGLRDPKNIMVVIARNVNMQQFAYVFKALGAKGALNLDTGGSTALYFNGAYKAGPGRNIPNAIIFAR